MRQSALLDVSRLLSGNLLAKLLGIASLMLFTRLLTKDQLAVFPAFLMLIGLANLFLSFGIYQYFLRQLPLLFRTDREQARSLCATGSLIIIGGTVPVAILAVVFRERISTWLFDDPRQSWIVIYASIGSIAYAVSKIVEFVMWARGQFTQTSIVQVAESVVRPVLTVVLFFAIGYNGVIIGLVVAQFVIAILSVAFVRDLFVGGRPAGYPLKHLFQQSMPYYLESYLWYVRGDGDSLLVSIFLGPAYLASYYVAKTLLTNLLVLWTAIDKVAVERLARDGAHAKDFGERVRQLHSRLSATIVPPVMALIAVAPYAVVIMAGPKYESSAVPAVFLLSVGLVQLQTIALDRALFVAGSPVVRLTKTAVESAASVISAFALAPSLGIVGIAIARLIGPLSGAAYGIFVLGRWFSLYLPLRDTVVPFLTALAPTVLILALAPRASGFKAAAISSVAAILVWITLFLLLTYVFNRPLFQTLKNRTKRLILRSTPVLPFWSSP